MIVSSGSKCCVVAMSSGDEDDTPTTRRDGFAEASLRELKSDFHRVFIDPVAVRQDEPEGADRMAARVEFH